MNFVVADRVSFVGGVGEAVLVAQVFLDLGIDGVDGFFFGDFEHAAAGFFGNLLEDFLAVGALLLRRVASTAATAAHSAAVTSHTKSAGSAVVILFIGKQDGVDDRVRALGGGDCLGHGFPAAVVHAVRKDDQCFAALLLAHQLVGAEEDCIIEERPSAV